MRLRERVGQVRGEGGGGTLQAVDPGSKLRVEGREFWGFGVFEG